MHDVNTSVNKCLTWYIRTLLKHPKIFIIVPLLIVYVIGYPTNYGFTVMKLNQFINNIHYAGFGPSGPTPSNLIGFKNNYKYDYDYKNIWALKNSDLKEFALSRLSFESDNVWSMSFLRSVDESIKTYLTESFGPTIVVSPIYDLQIDLEKDYPENYMPYIINHKSSLLMQSIYFKDIHFVNQLFHSAKIINIYFIHNANESVDGSKLGPYFKSVTTITSINGIYDFINYFLLLNYHGISKYVDIILNWVVVITFGVMFFHLYISIANLHKIHSSLGIMFAWIVEYCVAVGAGVSTFKYWNNTAIWQQNFQPSSFFTQATAIGTVTFVSSRNLIRIIIELSDFKKALATNEDSKVFQIKLFKFFIGFSNENDEYYEKIILTHKLFKLFNIDLTNKIKLPNITKILLLDFVFFIVIDILSVSVIKYFFADSFGAMLTSKMHNFLILIVIILIFDHFLQLTFLISTLMIDNYRVNVSKLLDSDIRNSLDADDGCESNQFSHLLLKNKPDRDSLQYKIGTYFTLVRYATSLKTWVISLPILQTINCFVMLTSWSFYIPYNLFQGSDILQIINITSLDLDGFYFLEFFITVVFYFAITLIIFQVSNYKINIVENLGETQFDDSRYFKDIDLKGYHYLDIIKLKSNNSSFLVTMGLDHRIFVWSPISTQSLDLNSRADTLSTAAIKPAPIEISSTISVNGQESEFWPVNFINISSNGEYIILANYKYKLIKCYCRKELKYIWTSLINDDINFSNDKVLESFFRERTLPGFMKMKQLKKTRKNSEISINGSSKLDSSRKSELDFIIVLESGKILTYCCTNGTLTSATNILEEVYEEYDSVPYSSTSPGVTSNNSVSGSITSSLQFRSLKLISVKKLFTPRVNDRIVCQVNNKDIIVAIVVNNKWKYSVLETRDDNYNIGFKFDTPMALSASNANSITGMNSYQTTHSFESSNLSYPKAAPVATLLSYSRSRLLLATNSRFEVNKPTIVTIEFVGMIVKVDNLIAELIDIQSGIILHKVNVGRFKPSSFRVAHLEPTHCKFCGCVSLKSLSIVYEDFEAKTVIVHTFKVQNNRSKTNICLRVERDPREIRCAGFSDVVEEQYWYENVSSWELTDINMIIGVKKNTVNNEISSTSIDYEGSYDGDNVDDASNSGRLRSLKLRNRKTTKSNISKPKESLAKWEGFIVTLGDGNLVYYEIPRLPESLVGNKINCIEKFGFKSVAVSFGSSVKILYLGNDKLIEENLYFNDLNETKAINNELLFINKRRKK